MKYLLISILKPVPCIMALVLGFCFLTANAQADISWMKGTTDCESFAPALDAYLDRVDLSKYSLFPFWQKEELAIALKEACFGNFSKCDLQACKKWGSLASFKIPNEAEVPSSLFWLNRFLTCEQLMEQIKSRYTNLPETEILSPVKQKEFRLILSTACSDRFSHCSFASCEKFNQGQIDRDQLTGLTPKLKEKSQVENYEALRASIIRLAEDQERENGLVWKKFSNSEEAEILSRRKEQARRRKQEGGSTALESVDDQGDYGKYSSASSKPRRTLPPKKKRNSYSSSSRSGLKQGILPF